MSRNSSNDSHSSRKKTTDKGASNDESSVGDTTVDENAADSTTEQSSAQTASDEQIAAAPNSTAARHAAGEMPNDSGTRVDPAKVDTGDRHPLHPSEQALTGAPAGADGSVTVRSETQAGPSVDDIKAAQRRQHEGLDGEGEHVVFNTTGVPLIIDREGHQLDGKARRRLREIDAVTRIALDSGDLVEETLDA